MQDKTTATSTRQPPADAPRVTVTVTDLVPAGELPALLAAARPAVHRHQAGR